MPGHPHHEMRDGICEDGSAEEISKIAGYKGHNVGHAALLSLGVNLELVFFRGAVKRQRKRRAAIEPVKEDHRMGRNFLDHREGDAINAVLAAAGYNFRRLLAWLALLLRLVMQAFLVEPAPQKV